MTKDKRRTRAENRKPELKYGQSYPIYWDREEMNRNE